MSDKSEKGSRRRYRAYPSESFLNASLKQGLHPGAKPHIGAVTVEDQRGVAYIKDSEDNHIGIIRYHKAWNQDLYEGLPMDAIYVAEILLLDEVRGHGMGTKAWRQFEALMKAEGINRIVIIPRKQLEDYWTRMGYRNTGRRVPRNIEGRFVFEKDLKVAPSAIPQLTHEEKML